MNDAAAEFDRKISKWIAALNEESDRGVAIVACSYLDDMLKNTIAEFLVPCDSTSKLLDGFAAPLGSFSARIASARALGLIDQIEEKELNTLRKIRNEFAHQIDCEFSTEKVRKLIEQLNFKLDSQVRFSSRGSFVGSTMMILTKLTTRFQIARASARLEPASL